MCEFEDYQDIEFLCARVLVATGHVVEMLSGMIVDGPQGRRRRTGVV